MEGCEDVQFKQCAVTECLIVENIPPIDIHCCMQAVLEVEEGSLYNQARLLRPVTATDKSHQECVKEIEKIVKSNRKTLLSNWESLKKEWAILSTFLDSRKAVPGGQHKIDWWEENTKRQSFKGTSGLFWRVKWGIFTAYSERWWNLGPSLWSWEQGQPMDYHHKGLPVPKKVKTSGGKVMLSVFWNSEGVVLTGFLDKGATVNSERYIITLKYLFKKKSWERGQKLISSCFNKTMPGLTQVWQLIPLPEVKAAVSQLFWEKEKYFF